MKTSVNVEIVDALSLNDESRRRIRSRVEKEGRNSPNSKLKKLEIALEYYRK